MWFFMLFHCSVFQVSGDKESVKIPHVLSAAVEIESGASTPQQDGMCINVCLRHSMCGVALQVSKVRNIFPVKIHT